MEKRFYLKNGNRVNIYILSIRESKLSGILDDITKYPKINDMMINIINEKNSLNISSHLLKLFKYKTSDIIERAILNRLLQNLYFEKLDIVIIGSKNREKELNKYYRFCYRKDKSKVKCKKLPLLSDLNIK